MRKIIIAGNWKLNKTSKEAIELITGIKREVGDVTEVDMVVCPVYTAIADARDTLEGSNVRLGAQNVYWEDSGAFTGEISAPILKAEGVKYVIIGHSERRQYFGETNETVNKRIKAALNHGLLPIVCVGEVLEEREAGKAFDVIKEQLTGSFAGITEEDMDKIVIAYEPVWAIGTGKTASPDQAQEVHKFIREWLSSTYSTDLAAGLKIQYGGSVKGENAEELMSQPDIDGALVGGASLNPESFAAIIKNCCGITK